MMPVTVKVIIVLLTIVLLLFFRKIISLFAVRKKMPAYNMSVDEISKALELTSEEIRNDKEILEGIIQFHDKTVAQIMTSRLDLFALEIQSGFKEVIENVIHAGYSRIPVYAETYDTIKGILYIKDLLPYIGGADHFCWQNLIRTAFFVPETKKIDDLLEEFRTNKIHLAIVVDEFGGTSGIVTMEDILEEIVGDINDEYDDEDSRFIKLPDDSYIFEAKTLLTDFFKITGIDSKKFDKLTEGVETLAGLILEIKGNFPEKQETVEFDKYAFQILEINQRRILKVKFFIKHKVS
jgi:gliding motility-associated protein GldE